MLGEKIRTDFGIMLDIMIVPMDEEKVPLWKNN